MEQRTTKNGWTFIKSNCLINMSFEDLFKHYDQNLTFYRLVISKNGRLKNFILLVGFVSFTVFMVLFLFTSQNVYAVLGLACGAIVTFLGRIFNRQTIQSLYGDEVSVDFWGWSTSDFNRMILKKLKAHLEMKKLDDLKRLEQIISITQNKIANEKLPSIFGATIFAGLSIPLWSSYLAKSMEIANGFSEASILLVIWLVFILVIALMSPIAIDIRDSLVTRQLKLMRFQDLLNEVILTSE